jgi:hypothetical protein
MKRAILRNPRLFGIVLLAALGACASTAEYTGGEFDVAPTEGATVEIDNQGFSEVRVFAYRGAERVRLGTVPAMSTRTLNIPNHLTLGTPIRFSAEPLASNARPTSQEMTVRPGDRLRLVVRP